MHIRCSDINKAFGQQCILARYSCDIPTGTSYALLGASGSGKSTLLNLLSGLDLPDSGEIYHDTNCISTQSTKWREQWRIQHIGILRQNPLLDPNLSAIENVLVPAVFRPIANATDQAYSLLGSLGLSQQLEQKSQTLSGGQAMRVALARCLMGQPKILIVDEPTGTLDHKTAQSLGEVLHQVSRTHAFTLIIATHDHQLAEHCDQCFEFVGTQSAHNTSAPAP